MFLPPFHLGTLLLSMCMIPLHALTVLGLLWISVSKSSLQRLHLICPLVVSSTVHWKWKLSACQQREVERQRKSKTSDSFVCIAVNVRWNTFSTNHTIIVRESIDSLYRDGTGEISRDPRTKRLKTQWEWLPRPSKYTRNSVRADIYLYTCSQRPHTHLQWSMREFAHTRFHDFRVIISSFSSSSITPLSPY